MVQSSQGFLPPALGKVDIPKPGTPLGRNWSDRGTHEKYFQDLQTAMDIGSYNSNYKQSQRQMNFIHSSDFHELDLLKPDEWQKNLDRESCTRVEIGRGLQHKILKIDTSWTQIGTFFSASDIAIAPDGTVYVVATDNRIYQWTGFDFEPFGGDGATAKTIAASKYEVWITNASNDIYRYASPSVDGYSSSGSAAPPTLDNIGFGWVDRSLDRPPLSNRSYTGAWRKIPGKAIDISIAPTNSQEDPVIFAVGEDYSILRWDRGQFVRMDGSAVRIAAGIDGKLWVVNGSNDVYEWNGQSWKLHSIKAVDVSVARGGDVCVVGTDGRVYYWAEADFIPLPIPAPVRRIVYLKNTPLDFGTIWTIGNNQDLRRGYEWLNYGPYSPYDPGHLRGSGVG